MRKLKKLVNNPGLFFRDFLVKKYPVINTEQVYHEQDEHAVIKNHDYLLQLDGRLSARHKEDPIDVVFTWVNNQDHQWKEKYKRYKNSTVDSEIGRYAQDPARFQNHNELYYSVFSVRKFLPWVRKIYIVTDQQSPEWYAPCDEIEIIDHQDIIDAKYLPTFNSHVIEAHLHKIDGLSENFIYFNDDVFVARFIDRSHFFRGNGIASNFVSSKSLFNLLLSGAVTPTLSASLNSQKLLQRKFSIQPDSTLVHTYIPLKKSTFKEVWEEYKVEIDKFLANKFRNNKDLNLATFLVPWYMYLNQKSVITPEVCYYFNIRSRHALMQYKKLLAAKELNMSPHSFCANDFNSADQQLPDYQAHLERMLNEYYFG